MCISGDLDDFSGRTPRGMAQHGHDLLIVLLYHTGRQRCLLTQSIHAVGNRCCVPFSGCFQASAYAHSILTCAPFLCRRLRCAIAWPEHRMVPCGIQHVAARLTPGSARAIVCGVRSTVKGPVRGKLHPLSDALHARTGHHYGIRSRP